MMKVVALLLTALLSAVSVSAKPAAVECPLPPYQLPLVAPERSFVDEQGQVFVDGDETPLDLDGLTATELVWSDDGEILLIAANSPDFESHVFAYRDGELTGALGGETLGSMRTEEFRKAVQIFNPAFIPGTHTVLFNTRLITDGDGIYFEIPSDLWSLHVDSGTLTRLLPYGEGGRFYIAPDASRLVLMDMERIWTADIDGQNPREVSPIRPLLGFGEEISFPPVVWDTSGEALKFRTLLFPSYSPDNGILEAPFEVREFTLGEEITSELILEGPAQFMPSVRLSPDGYRVALWSWDDPSDPQTLIVTVYAPDAEPVILDSVEVESAGLAPFVQWDDETHLSYGFINYNEEQLVTSWRADLCGEITALEPYQAQIPSQQ